MRDAVYAYPELVEPRFTIFLDKSTAELLTADSRETGSPAPTRISEILSNYYKNQDKDEKIS